jgi:hypothetical protein
MSNQDGKEFRELVSKLCDGELPVDDENRLNALLSSDPIAQEAYLDHLMLEGLLQREFGSGRADLDGVAASKSSATGGGTDSLSADASHAARRADARGRRFRPGVRRRSPFSGRRWSQWAAALLTMLLVGVLGGRWVWGPQLRLKQQPRPIPLSDAGFELNDSTDLATEAPWYGDQTETVGQFLGVRPVEGRRMLRFVKSSTEPGNACEVYQLVDLRSQSRVARGDVFVEASAFFNSLHESVNENDYTFGITVFAFSDDPSDESKAWPVRWQRTLMFAGRQLPADSDPQSWQPVNTRLPLPAGTRFLIVQLSVIRTGLGADSEFPGQLADKVALNLVTSK